MKSIPTYSCPRSADVPLAPRSEESPSPCAFPPHPRNQPPAFGQETDWAKLGALIAVIAFRGRFSGTRTRAGLGTTPQNQRGVVLLAFFEVTLQRTPPLPPPPEFATGTFPSALITTIWNGGRRGAGRRCFPKFSGPPGIPSSPLKTWLGAAPRTCSSRNLGHKHQPRGAKICSKRGKLCGVPRSGQRGRGSRVPGGLCLPGVGAARLLSCF